MLFVAVLSQSQLRLPTCRAILTSESFCRARRVTSFHITDLVHSPLKTYTRCVTPAVANGRGSLLPGVMLTHDHHGISPMRAAFVAQPSIDIETPTLNITNATVHAASVGLALPILEGLTVNVLSFGHLLAISGA